MSKITKKVTRLHQSWIDEAIASGPARPMRKNQWEKITQRALRRVRARKR